MRKIAILVVCLLSSSFLADIANSQPKAAPNPAPKGAANPAPKGAPNPSPSNYRAQVIRQMSQAYTVTRIRDAGITPPAYRSVSLLVGSRWVVCVTTFENGVLFGTNYRLTTITFNNGQAEIQNARMVRPGPGSTGNASRTKLNVNGPCAGLITSPLPEIARAGKPS